MRRKIIGYRCYFWDGRHDFPDRDSAYSYWRKAPPRWDVPFSSACTPIWDERKGLGVLEKIIKVFAIIFGAAVSIVTVATVIIALPAFFATAVPAILADIKLALKLIYQSILPEQGLLRKLFNGIGNVVNNYVVPTLKWTFGKVKELSGAIYQSYTLTIGGIVQTYDSLFGWVDSLRVKVNGILDNTNAIADVLGLDPNGKIEKLKQDFNELLDKWFVSWFDKILTKIDEAVGPILTKISEIEAFASNIYTTLTDVFTPAKRFVDDMNTGSAVDEVDTADAIDTTTQHPPEETTPAGEEAAKEYEPEPEKESAFDRLMDKYAAKIYNTAEKFMDMVDASIDLTEEEIKQSSWMQLYYPDDDVLALDEGSFANDFFLYLLGDLNFADLMRYHWKEVIFHQKRFNTRQEAINYYSEIWQEMERSGVPERKIEKAKKKDMKRINDMFPVPEREF